MKTTTLLLLILSVIMFSCSDSSKEGKAELNPEKSAEVKFKSEYPDAKEVEWEEDGDYMEVEFELKGIEYSVVYDKEGNVVEKEMEIEPESLPENVLTYITENYPEAEVEEAEKLFKDDAVFFEVEIESDDDDEIELLFASDGSFMDEAIEEDDEDDEDGEEEEENETEIDPSELMPAILDYITQNYADYAITEAEMDESDEGVFYEVELTSANGDEIDLIFDSEGNFLEEE